MANPPLKINLDKGATKVVEDIAKDLGMDDIEVIRNGLKLMSLYADLKKQGGRILIQTKQDEPAQELNIS
ncbi:MAG: hypothetical protein AB4041_16050 [Microcystaceae cyanobacterium]